MSWITGTGTRAKKDEAELERLNRDILTFTYLFNHNLQEPIRNIQMISSLIMEKEEKNLSDEGKEYFRRIRDSARLLRAQVQGLLQYANTKSKTGFVETDIDKILNEVKDDLRMTIRATRARIISTGFKKMKVIPLQWRTLMLDLISNSLKFSNPDAPPRIFISHEEASGAIHPSLDKKKKYHHITITDNGIGFEPRYSERIFQVFQKLNGTRYKGTGIGLAICKRIVENHNGLITAFGEPGKGARFDIYIPA